jgi:hypothetical protein
MLKFNEFLKEEYSDVDVIDIDSKLLESNRASINSELDTLTEKPYQNAPIFLAQLRGCLERYGMLLPAEATANFLNLEAELVYSLGSTPLHLYIVFDTSDDGFVDGYAQIVDESELSELFDMDKNEMLSHDPIKQRSSTFYAKRDDDAGNNNEYGGSAETTVTW